jgi:hypothetical protein
MNLRVRSHVYCVDKEEEQRLKHNEGSASVKKSWVYGGRVFFV